MRQYTIFFIAILFVVLWTSVSAQTADWSWVRKAGGTSADDGTAIAVDSSGNSYVTGYYTGTTTFGTINLTNSGLQDIYVAKMDTNGNWLWAKKAGGTSADLSAAIAVDVSGNVYITGSFNSATVAFGSYSLSRNSTSNDVFIAKLDTTGNWLWAKKAGGTSVDNGQTIVTDTNSNVYVGGNYRSTATFGTLPTISALGYADAFVTKLDTSGNFLWVATAGGTNPESVTGIAVDTSGNVIIDGGFNSDTATFGTVNLANSGNSTSDIFVAKLSSAGTWLWAKKAGGTGSDSANDIAMDSAGNIYVTGYKEVTALFGSISLTTYGSMDIFAAKMDSNGTWLWAKRAGGVYYDVSWNIVVDNWSNIYLTGEFRGTALFGSTTITNASTTISDVFMAKMNSSGVWLGAKSLGDVQTDVGKSVALDSNANIYWLGNFLGTISFDGTPLTSNTSSQDIYVAKQSNTPVLLQAPNGGENWLLSSTHSIQWTSLNVSTVLLDYSYDAGVTWYPIIQTPISATLGTYSWTLPDSASTQAMVRIRSGASDNVFDTSDAIFTVISSASPPQAGFSANVTNGVEPLSIQFTDSSIPVTGTIVSWAWVFGDGGTSALQNPSHIYQNDGIYSVSLTVTNSATLTNMLTRTNYITVVASNPQIDLESADSLDFGSINVNSQSAYQNVIIRNTGNTNVLLNTFHFSGAQLNFEYLPPTSLTITPGNTATIQVRFTPHSAGALSDVLYIENSSLNLPILTVPLSGTGVVVNNPPTANFTANLTSGLNPLTVQFTDSSSAGSGTISTWAWTFGDGGTSALQSPQHIYTTGGVFSVTLTVTNSYTLSNTLTRTNYITVTNPAPIFALLTSTNMNFGSVNIGSQSTYQNVSFKNNGNANLIVSDIHFISATSNFQFIQPNPALNILPGNSGSISVRFAPLASGALSDTLFVVNNSTNSPIVRIRLNGTGVQVNNPPTASFTANLTSGLNPLTVQFTDSSVPVSGSISTWAWTFGDGGTSALQNPQYIYTSAGVFSVSLTVTNSFSLSNTLTRTNYISVTNPAPGISLISGSVMNFGSIDVDSQSAYQNVLISNNGNANLSISDIHFIAAQSNFQFIEPSPALNIVPGGSGAISVRFAPLVSGALSDTLFIVNNSVNAPITKVRLNGTGVLVDNHPLAAYSADVTSGLVPLTVQFTDSSVPVSGSITSWAWDFGDGTTSSQQHPQHVFQAVGTYDISLTVTNSLALSATLLRNDYITVSNPTAILALLSPAILNFGSVYSGVLSAYQPVIIKNNGNRDLAISNIHFSGAVQNFEYTATTESLLLTPGETDTVFVRFIPQGEGLKTAFLQIENDSDNTPLLQVRLDGIGLVPEPKTPANMTVSIVNRDVHLSWTPVSENVLNQTITVDYYVVFVNGTTDLENGFSYHGLTQTPSYVHVLATLYSKRMFYRVYAESISVRGLDITGKQALDNYIRGHLLPGMSIPEVNSVMRSARQRLEQWQSI